MNAIPIVDHFRPDPPQRLVHAAERMLATLRHERPELMGDERLRAFAADELDDRPALHLDDASDIPMLESGRSISYQQDRSRQRATDGDFIATCIAPVEGYEEYCRDRLQIGAVRWLSAQPPVDSVQVAARCWQDGGIRESLLRAVRQEGLRFIHPHMGSQPVWELAGLLSEATGETVRVIAPPPAVTEWVNDKLAMADLVQRLFGSPSIPKTDRAPDLAHAAEIVKRLAESCSAVTLKLPDSVGGGGNVVMDAAEFRGQSLTDVRERLKFRFAHSTWEEGTELLISCWETQICGSPSAQLWIPPENSGPPVVEGLCEQDIGDPRGVCVGTRPAELPADLGQVIVNRCWLLARLFQQLGYVGRCSFDLLLVGESPSACRPEFLECNGRWGAASLPMTLMNRLFGDWRNQPYAVRDVPVKGLDQVPFRALVDALGEDLYDARTGQGTLVLCNPARMTARSSLTVLALGSSWSQAAEMLVESIPAKLADVVRQIAL